MVRTRTRNYPNTYPVKRRRAMGAATARKLARLRTPEVKRKDFTSPFLTSGVGLVTQIVPVQGDDGDDFIGNKCHLERVDTSCVIGAEQAIRLTVLMPKDPSSAPTPLTGTARYTEDQFVILYDELISPTGNNMCARRKVNVNRYCEYSSAQSSTPIKGNLYVCWNTTANTTMQTRTRLYFTDN